MNFTIESRTPNKPTNMRLRQLARKLEITPEDIIELLADQGMTIDDRSNIKLEEEHVRLVYDKFSDPFEQIEEEVETEENTEPALVASESIDDEPEARELSTEAMDQQPEEMPEPTETKNMEEVTEQAEVQSEDLEVEVEEEVEEPSASKIEVIKAPKVTLPGLKVVGKIDLPEPKPKVDETPEGDEDATTAPKEPRRKVKKANRGRQYDRKPRRKLSLEEQRQRDEKEKLRKKQETEKRKKELRREKYLEQVKEVSAQKQRKSDLKKRKKKEQEPAAVKPKKHTAPPKTVLGKFWRWLNT